MPSYTMEPGKTLIEARQWLEQESRHLPDITLPQVEVRSSEIRTRCARCGEELVFLFESSVSQNRVYSIWAGTIQCRLTGGAGKEKEPANTRHPDPRRLKAVCEPRLYDLLTMTFGIQDDYRPILLRQGQLSYMALFSVGAGAIAFVVGANPTTPVNSMGLPHVNSSFLNEAMDRHAGHLLRPLIAPKGGVVVFKCVTCPGNETLFGLGGQGSQERCFYQHGSKNPTNADLEATGRLNAMME